MKVVFKNDILSVNDIYNFINKGVTVYWGSHMYTIIAEKTEHNEYTEFSKNGDFCLMIKNSQNGSKSLLEKGYIKDCFINK